MASSDGSSEADFQPMENKTLLKNLDPSERGEFIRKVFALAFIQLLISFVVAAILFTNPAFAVYPKTMTLISAMLAVFIVRMPEAGYAETLRDELKGYCILVAFSVAYGVVVGCITARYQAQFVILALGSTVLITAWVSFFAFIFKSNFSGLGPLLMDIFATASTVGVASLVPTDYDHASPKHRMTVCAGGALFTAFLIVDVQMILTGNNFIKNFEFTTEDYVLGALNLYRDVIQIFVCVVEVFGRRG
mmetsp:Transcript_9841/g.21649  ORF Transcript_9841/g.21649 Transcript_9841/m.21649 type:complete len:248 (-) Transcript_9841:83-826(-)